MSETTGTDAAVNRTRQWRSQVIDKMPTCAALSTALLGSTVLAGWVGHSAAMRTTLGVGVEVNYLTALVFVLIAAALRERLSNGRSPFASAVASGACLSIISIAVLKLGDVALGWHTNLDTMLFRGQATALRAIPGMTSSSAFSALLIGVALLLVRSRHDLWRNLGRASAVVGSLIPAIALVMHLFQSLTGTATVFATNIALGWVIASVGIVSLKSRDVGDEDSQSAGLQLRVRLTLAVAVAILVITCGVSIWSNLSSREIAVLRSKSLMRETNIALLVSSVGDAETGQRGFLLTGNSAFLTPYDTALKVLPKQRQELASLMAPTPRGKRVSESLIGRLPRR